MLSFIIAGQQIAKQIENQIKKATQKLSTTVKRYNECAFSSSSESPNNISFEDVKDPEAAVYHILDVDFQVETLIFADLVNRQTTKIWNDV